MIFVSVGTTTFEELVQRMDELAPTLGEEVVCQIGRGVYTPKHCKYFRFAPSLDDYLRRARLVIGHGGLGTVLGAVRHGKPFVGVSNPDRPDLHQDEILGRFEVGNYIIWCRSLDQLDECIARAGKTAFATYTEVPCQIPEVIERFLRGEAVEQRARPVLGVRL